MNIQLKRYIYDNDECTRWQYLFEKRKLKVLEIYETKKNEGKTTHSSALKQRSLVFFFFIDTFVSFLFFSYANTIKSEYSHILFVRFLCCIYSHIKRLDHQ